jgi:hypothetical protein
MTWQRNFILSIVTAGCYLILLAAVLNSVLGASNDHHGRRKSRAAHVSSNFAP